MKEGDTEESIPARLPDAKDEMNLAEFPLCAIADRLSPGQKTLAFEDRTWDALRGEMITRRLVITGSDEYGLPTALDDEILLGLIQLSKIQSFASRKVNFTRYHLLRLLGWGDDHKSYHRLEKSLNRWVGVTLYYKNAWWDKAGQCWADEKFHVLDNVTLLDRDQVRRQRQSGRQAQLPLSSFVWNEVIFRSFQAGNLKSIDFDFFKGLQSSIAKRLYRFLDKRFFHRARWEFDLKELCWEHIGMSRNYDTANLKRKLQPGIDELVTSGFLRPMTAADRFRKVTSGEWRAVFEKARTELASSVHPDAPSSEARPLQEALIERGVTPTAAREVAMHHPLEQIRTQLEVFDWMLARQDQKVLRNPAGFLVASIKSEYMPPKGFVSRAEQESRAAAMAARKQKAEERKRAEEERERLRLEARQQAIQNFWGALSPEEKVRLESEAFSSVEPFQRDLIVGEGTLARATRQSILDAFALRMLQQEL